MTTVKADNVVYKLYTRRARHGEIRVRSPYWQRIFVRDNDNGRWTSDDGKWIPMLELEANLEFQYQLHVKV